MVALNLTSCLSARPLIPSNFQSNYAGVLSPIKPPLASQWSSGGLKLHHWVVLTGATLALALLVVRLWGAYHHGSRGTNTPKELTPAATPVTHQAPKPVATACPPREPSTPLPEQQPVPTPSAPIESPPKPHSTPKEEVTPPPLRIKPPNLPPFKEVLTAFAQDTYTQYTPEEAAATIAKDLMEKREEGNYDLENPQTYAPFHTVFKNLNLTAKVDTPYLTALAQVIPEDVWITTIEALYLSGGDVEYFSQLIALLTPVDSHSPTNTCSEPPNPDINYFEHFCPGYSTQSPPSVIDHLFSAFNGTVDETVQLFGALSLENQVRSLFHTKEMLNIFMNYSCERAIRGNLKALQFLDQTIFSPRGQLESLEMEYFFTALFEKLEEVGPELDYSLLPQVIAKVCAKLQQQEESTSRGILCSIGSPFPFLFKCMLKVSPPKNGWEEQVLNSLIQNLPLEFLSRGFDDLQNWIIMHPLSELRSLGPHLTREEDRALLLDLFHSCQEGNYENWLYPALESATEVQMEGLVTGLLKDQNFKLAQELLDYDPLTPETSSALLTRISNDSPNLRQGLCKWLYGVGSGYGNYRYETLPASSSVKAWHATLTLEEGGPIDYAEVDRVAQELWPKSFERHPNWYDFVNGAGYADPAKVQDPKEFLSQQGKLFGFPQFFKLSTALSDKLSTGPAAISKYEANKWASDIRLGNGIHLTNRPFKPGVKMQVGLQPVAFACLARRKVSLWKTFCEKWEGYFNLFNLGFPRESSAATEAFSRLVLQELYTKYLQGKGYSGVYYEDPAELADSTYVFFKTDSIESVHAHPGGARGS